MARGLGGAIPRPQHAVADRGQLPEGQVRDRALGALSMLAGLVAALGYLLGSVLTAELSWRWCETQLGKLGGTS